MAASVTATTSATTGATAAAAPPAKTLYAPKWSLPKAKLGLQTAAARSTSRRDQQELGGLVVISICPECAGAMSSVLMLATAAHDVAARAAVAAGLMAAVADPLAAGEVAG